VLIPSFGRPAALTRCLASLTQQTLAPDEVVVVWQATDDATRDAALSFEHRTPFSLIVVHSPARGITCSENAALRCSRGAVVLLIDDDATAPRDWVERHLSHFEDPTVGAVGGPADNYTTANAPFPRREPHQIGRITWYGRCVGNMYDYPAHWKHRRQIDVDQLVGYNMAVRRAAFEGFEERLKPYWQKFETDICLQVGERGYRVLFDFANVVNHYPTNTVYAPGRGGDLEAKVYGAAYNWAFVLSKHSPPHLRACRLLYLLLLGSTSTPGLLGVLVNAFRGNGIIAEVTLLPRILKSFLSGWNAGARARVSRSNARSVLFRHNVCDTKIR